MVMSLDELIGTNLEESYLPSVDLDIEAIIFKLSSAEVELLIWKYLGYTSSEIVQFMKLHDISAYYRLNRKLQRNYRKLIKSQQ